MFLGESVVAVAAGTAGTNWRVDSAAAAVLGFVALAAVWGITLKFGGAAVILCLLAAESTLPPLALAAGVALVLVAIVFAERTLIGAPDALPVSRDP